MFFLVHVGKYIPYVGPVDCSLSDFDIFVGGSWSEKLLNGDLMGLILSKKGTQTKAEIRIDNLV